MTRRIPWLAAPLLLGACATPQPVARDAGGAPPQPTPMVETATSETAAWERAATGADIARLRGWRATFDAAVAQVLAGEEASRIAAAAPLYDRDAALAYAPPPQGMYECATMKLGGAYIDLIEYAYFRCQIVVENGRRQFVKLTGSQRPVGYVYEGDSRHGVFLGTLQLGDDAALVPYGREPDRDQIARVERIGPTRWRMIFPEPAREAEMNIIDLKKVPT